MVQLKPGNRTTEFGAAVVIAALIVGAEKLIGRPLSGEEITGLTTLGVGYTAGRALPKALALLGRGESGQQQQTGSRPPPPPAKNN